MERENVIFAVSMTMLEVGDEEVPVSDDNENTRAGKLNTIAKVLQTIFEKKGCSAKGAKFVIIDSNGEYNKAFSKLNDVLTDI